jgi:acetyl esterase/lipase
MHKLTDDMIHPELREKARSLRKKPPRFSLLKTKLLNKLCRLLKGRHDRSIRYQQIYVSRTDGSKLRLCVYMPPVRKDHVPGLLWLHGGGYSLGILEQDDDYIRRFINASGCVVVAPDYTLSLDKPYPAALYDCYSALLWLRDNGPDMGMRNDQIFIGGTSAGGGLTAALCLYARDQGEVPVAFQMPLYPRLDDRPAPSSADDDAPLWHTAANEASWRLYLGDFYRAEKTPPYAAAGRAQDYQGLPPACTFVGSIEPFHDETLAYAENLKKCGIPVHSKVYPGCFHAFDQICPQTAVAEDARSFLMESFAYAVGHYFRG